jgi:hypothetical protein
LAQDVHPELRDERGSKLPNQPLQAATFGALMARLAGSFDPGQFPLLAGIDPYGVTVFNDVQKTGLADELTRYTQLAPREMQEDVHSLAAFVRDLSDQRGVYIWFIGD